MARVLVDSSQFPDHVWRDLVACFQNRQIAHKFHYETYKQSAKWHLLHEAYSPSRNDAGCAAMYERSFATIASGRADAEAQVIGIGCGSGEKDVRLLEVLAAQGTKTSYTASDVSLGLLLSARQKAIQVIPENRCKLVMCDLERTREWRALLVPETNAGVEVPSSIRNMRGGVNVFTFFGMIPNFEPSFAFERLSNLLASGDLLVLNANLAPGADYAAGVERILPQYDNTLTRDWLLTFLVDHGFELEDGEVRFGIEDSFGLKRIVADFVFRRGRVIKLGAQEFEFRSEDQIRLFFSYRYTPALIREWLSRYKLNVLEQWISPSEEEGVFLVGKESG